MINKKTRNAKKEISYGKKLIGIAVIAIMLFGIFGLAGCNPKPKNIVATAMFSKNILELPVKGTLPNAPGQYYIDMDMVEIFSTISLDNSLSTEFVDGKIFVSKDNDDGTKDYYLIRQIAAANGNKMYEFFDMGGLIKLDATYKRILIPYHLIDIDWEIAHFDIATEYETKFRIDNFFEYYSSSGWYDIEKGTDYIVINGYVDEERILALNNSLPVPLKHMEFGLPIKIKFTSYNMETNTFVISFIVE